jgi:hypothetical protein
MGRNLATSRHGASVFTLLPLRLAIARLGERRFYAASSGMGPM